MLTFQNRKGDDSLRCTFRTAVPGKIDREVLEALAFCIRDEYQDTYSDPRLYDVNTLVSMVEENKLMTAAAIREDGEPVAVINLKECPPFEGVGDLSMHVVRRKFRGYGIGTPLVQYIMGLPETGWLTGIVSHSATYHSIAQHESFWVGLRPCGALYSQHINALLSHSFEKVGVKQTFLVAACTRGKLDAGVLYLPREHRDFAASCYRSMEAACCIAEEGSCLADDTQLQFWQDEIHQTLMAQVNCCGEDLKEKVGSMLNVFGARCPLETATLFLNCSDPSAEAGYRILRDMGFRFAGFHPLCRSGEYMILHHPMQMEVPFDRMHVDDSYRAVYDYLRNHFDD